MSNLKRRIFTENRGINILREEEGEMRGEGRERGERGGGRKERAGKWEERE